MAILQSYDLNGQKLSFANWVSNITPTDTPFLSMTKKEPVEQTMYQWQTDSLQSVENNAQLEGWESGTAPTTSFRPTRVMSNYTQIVRKVISVSDTAEAVETYGRDKEMSYQMEKAGKEIKRDLEWAFLNNYVSSAGSATTPRITAGYPGLCSGVGVPDADTKAVLNFDVPELKEETITGMCGNLYLNGSNATVIMYHPKHARFFSKLQEKDPTRKRLFENVPVYDILVNIFEDQFGKKYKLVPNRNMSEDKIFFFNPENWSQKILRPPQRKKLAKMGSFTQWMIEMEVGLAHINPEASGMVNIRANPRCEGLATKTVGDKVFGTDVFLKSAEGTKLDFTFKSGNAADKYDVDIYQDDILVGSVSEVKNDADKVWSITSPEIKEHTGVYKFILKDFTTKAFIDESNGMYIEII